MSKLALVVFGLAFVGACTSASSAGDQSSGPAATAPTAPSQPASDLSTWLSYSDQQYGVALRYPPSYTVVQLTNPLQPAPIFRLGFQLASLTNPAGPEPPQFEVDVYDNASRQSLDDWLARNVVNLGPAARDAVQVGGASGIEIAYQRLLAPNTFYYVARGSFVYRFVPLGAYSDAMLGTVQFTR